MTPFNLTSLEAQVRGFELGDSGSSDLVFDPKPVSHESKAVSTDSNCLAPDTPSHSCTGAMVSSGSIDQESVLRGAESLQSFTKFPDLVTELRAMIWRRAIFPRVIGFNLLGLLRASPYTPALLHVDVEARRVSLSAYRAVRACAFDDQRMIYFNIESDTLLLYTHGVANLEYAEIDDFRDRLDCRPDLLCGAPLDFAFVPSIISKVKTLALDVDKLKELFEAGDLSWTAYVLKLMRENKSLEKVIVIWSHDDPTTPIDQIEQHGSNREGEVLVIQEQFKLDWACSLTMFFLRRQFNYTATENQGWNKPMLTHGHVDWRKP